MQLPPALAALSGQGAAIRSSGLVLGSQDRWGRLHSLTQVQHGGGLAHRPVLWKVLDGGLTLAQPQEPWLGGCRVLLLLLLWGQQRPRLPQLLGQHKPMAQHPWSLRRQLGRTQHPLLVGGQEDLALRRGVAQHRLMLQPRCLRVAQQAWLLLG